MNSILYKKMLAENKQTLSDYKSMLKRFMQAVDDLKALKFEVDVEDVTPAEDLSDSENEDSVASSDSENEEKD